MLIRNLNLWLLHFGVLLCSCNAQNGEQDLPPTATQVQSVTATLVLQQKQSLDPGVIYASPKDNLFRGNLLPGPLEPATFGVQNDTEEAPKEICSEPGEGLNMTWADLLQMRLFPNKTFQQVGFSRDLLPFLDDIFNKSIISEITLGRFFDQCNTKNKTKDGSCEPEPPTCEDKNKQHHKRKVFLPDDRDEVENTRNYPWNTIGVIGKDVCTGWFYH
jgi:hypothetical protein